LLNLFSDRKQAAAQQIAMQFTIRLVSLFSSFDLG